MLRREARAFLAQSAKPLRVNGVHEAGIQVDRTQERQPVEDRGEGTPPGLARRLTHPGEAADMAAAMRLEEGVDADFSRKGCTSG